MRQAFSLLEDSTGRRTYGAAIGWHERCRWRREGDRCVRGLVILANASKGHAQSDEERDRLLEFVMDRVRGQVPVIVTVTHFAT